MAKFEYDYYSGAESEQFRFLKIPKVFFEDPDYGELGLAECVLYGFLHEQVALSKRNGWIDEEGKTYVIRSLESIQKVLRNCSADKARATLKNLIDYGLIEKKRRGQGKPDLIYVKNFVTKKEEKTLSGKPDGCGKLFSETGKTDALNAEKASSGSRNFRVLEAGNPAPNDTDNSYTEDNETPSIHPDIADCCRCPIRVYAADGLMDEQQKKEKEREAYAQLIRENLDYDRNMQSMKYDTDRKLFDDFYQVILEVVLGDAGEYKINNTVLPQAVVKSRMLRLDGDDVLMAIQQISEVTEKIHNIRGYMISTLYNAPVTTGMFIANDVQHGMYGGGWDDMPEKGKHGEERAANG